MQVRIIADDRRVVAHDRQHVAHDTVCHDLQAAKSAAGSYSGARRKPKQIMNRFTDTWVCRIRP
jgi:hypothetical protein